MRGNLNEIDIRTILQLIEMGQRTGQLFVETSSDRHQQGQRRYWFVFFLNGEIIYCQDGDSCLSRLQDYLQHYRVQTQLDETNRNKISKALALEYGYIWNLCEQNLLDPTQARSIIRDSIEETIFDLLSLHQGSFIFEPAPPLSPQLTVVPVSPLISKVSQNLQEWKLLYPYIQSPDQFPVLANITQLKEALPAATVSKLKQWAEEKHSLRQQARFLKRDVLTVAKAIYPYVEQGWMKLIDSSILNTRTSEQYHKKRIVCIDDTETICSAVESILQPLGYEVYGLTNPLSALSSVFQLQPDLIFCDITMPELDGYEICAMLRNSSTFRSVPLIVLTALDGYMDRVKAKMVGATDYLSKPFAPAEILLLVEKYLNYYGVSAPLGRYNTC